MTHHINFVFHNVVEVETPPANRYTISTDFFASLVDRLIVFLGTKTGLINARFYFDDNHKSCVSLAAPILVGKPIEKVIAVPVESIGKAQHCSIEELQMLFRDGFVVSPHGYSHSALAIFVENELQSTPAGGEYRNALSGKDRVLSEAEVLFQLVESKRALSEFSPNEFVLPFGLYNEQTISLNGSHKIFERLTTCDPYLDCGESLRPRILVTNEQTVDEVFSCVAGLKPRQDSNLSE